MYRSSKTIFTPLKNCYFKILNENGNNNLKIQVVLHHAKVSTVKLVMVYYEKKTTLNKSRLRLRLRILSKRTLVVKCEFYYSKNTLISNELVKDLT